jgi:hypothetical protein
MALASTTLPPAVSVNANDSPMRLGELVAASLQIFNPPVLGTFPKVTATLPVTAGTLTVAVRLAIDFDTRAVEGVTWIELSVVAPVGSTSSLTVLGPAVTATPTHVPTLTEIGVSDSFTENRKLPVTGPLLQISMDR